MGKSEKKSKSKRINILRQRYEEFLEEDRKRKERNEFILCRLDQIRHSSGFVSRSRFFSRALPAVTVEAPTPPRRNEYGEKQITRPQYAKPKNSTIIRPEELLLHEISKKFILIPRCSSIEFENMEVPVLTKTDASVTTESEHKNDSDWRSKYEILDHLKIQERNNLEVPPLNSKKYIHHQSIDEPEKDTFCNITIPTITAKDRNSEERRNTKLSLPTDREYYNSKEFVIEPADVGLSLKDINENEPLNNITKKTDDNNYEKDYTSDKDLNSINNDFNNVTIDEGEEKEIIPPDFTEYAGENDNNTVEIQNKNNGKFSNVGPRIQTENQEVFVSQSINTLITDPTIVKDHGSIENESELLHETSPQIYKHQNDNGDEINKEISQDRSGLNPKQFVYGTSEIYEQLQQNELTNSDQTDQNPQDYDQNNYIYENQTVYEQGQSKTSAIADIHNYETNDAVPLQYPGPDQVPYEQATTNASDNMPYDPQANSHPDQAEVYGQHHQTVDESNQQQVYSYPTEELVEGPIVQDQTSDQEQVYSNVASTTPQQAPVDHDPNSEHDLNLMDQQQYQHQTQEQARSYEENQPEYDQQLLPQTEALLQDQNSFAEPPSNYYVDPNNLPQGSDQQPVVNTLGEGEYQQDALIQQPYYEHDTYNEQQNYSTQEAADYVQNPNMYPENYDPSQQQYNATGNYDDNSQPYQDPANYDQTQYYTHDQPLADDQQMYYQQGDAYEQQPAVPEEINQFTTPTQIQPQINTPSDLQETVDEVLAAPIKPQEVN